MADPQVRIERWPRLDAATTAQVGSLIQRAAVHDRHSPIGEHKFLRLRQGDERSLALVARSGGELVGYAHATCFPGRGALPPRLVAELLVDPVRRGQGIGRMLVERLMHEGREAALDRLDIWAHHADAAVVHLADRLGMHATRQLWQMALRLDSVLPKHRRLPVPGDVRLRRFRAGSDERLLVRLIRDAFPEHPENATFDEDDLAYRVRLPWFDPSAILLASDAGSDEILGLNWMKLEPERSEGEVYILGVVPGAQGRGVGRILLAEGLEEMRTRGIGLAYLYVDADNEPAVALYRQAGFRYEHLDTCYSLDL